MTNRYYTATFDPSVGSLIKSAAETDQFLLIQAGFDLIQQAIDTLSGQPPLGFPTSLAGQALKYLQVNAAETGYQFATLGLSVKTVSTTTYTLVAGDANSLIIFTNASAVTVTVPPSIMSQGDIVCMRQGNTGQVTLSAGGGVTLNSSDNLLATRAQSAQIAVVADGSNSFGVIGDRNSSLSGIALLAAANDFTKGQTVAPVALTDGATINTDASLSNSFYVTLGGNRTLANPTNLQSGQIINWKITQDGTGSRTLSYGNQFKWPGGTAPTLSTAAGKVDRITGQYWGDATIIDCSYALGIA